MNNDDTNAYDVGASQMVQDDFDTAASNLEFEEAARLRDELRRLEAIDLGIDVPNEHRSTGKPKGKDKGRRR